MPEANRKKMVACIAMMGWVLFFWVSIVALILKMTEISLLASICYAVCTIVLEKKMFGKHMQIKKRLLMILLTEALQIVPCLLIFVLQN